MLKKMIWPFSFYFLYFAALSAFMPFIVLFYQQLEFNGTQIGLLTGLPPLVTLVAGPFWTGVADVTRRHSLIIGLGTLASAFVVFFLPTFTSFISIFILVILFNIFLSPVGSMSDSATISMLGEERAMYGRIRLGGTLGWGIFAQIAGILLYLYGLKALFYVFSAIMLINFFISQKLSFGKHEDQESKTGGIRTLLTSRRWIIFLLLAFLGGMGAFSVASYLSSYLKELGANGNQIGFAFTAPTLAELLVFFFGNRLIKRFNSYGLFVIALGLIGIRSLLFGAANTLFLAILVQALGGLVYPAMWLAGVAYADENAPVGLKSSAQGLFGATTFGFGSAVGGFVGGLLLESLGGRGMFLVFGILILLGLVLIEGVRRILPAETNPQPLEAE